MDEEYIKTLLSHVKCGHCGHHCEPANIDLLGHEGDLWLFSVYCPSCKSQGLVTVATKESKVPEVAAELTEAEESKFSTPISSDDVIDMHVFLNDFSNVQWVTCFKLNCVA